jgi:hypothetical protein
MSINSVTHDPFAYLDRALPNEPVAMYVPKERLDADGNKVADENGFGADGFGFDDFLDIINPLQHIPGVSSVYREITGDELSPGARNIGGMIYGGAIGLAVSVVNSAIEEATGKDVGAHVISLFSTDEEEAAPTEMVAAAPTKAEMAPAPLEATANMKKVPGALAPIESAPLAAPILPTEQQPEMMAEEKIPAISPIGLEWKGDKPALLQQLENAKAQNLTEEQLHAVFRSFNTAPSALAAPTANAKAATTTYQKTAAAVEPMAENPVAGPAVPSERQAP